jgi:VanZ family protein
MNATMTPLADHLRRARKPLTWACAVAWVSAFTITHIPVEAASHIPGSDSSLHFIGYLVITGILWLTLATYPLPRWHRIVWTFLATIAYSTLDELTQPLFGRACALGDWRSNLMGIISLLIAAELLTFLFSRKENAETH